MSGFSVPIFQTHNNNVSYQPVFSRPRVLTLSVIRDPNPPLIIDAAVIEAQIKSGNNVQNTQDLKGGVYYNVFGSSLSAHTFICKEMTAQNEPYVWTAPETFWWLRDKTKNKDLLPVRVVYTEASIHGFESGSTEIRGYLKEINLRAMADRRESVYSLHIIGKEVE